MVNRIRKAIQEKGHAVGTFLGLATPPIVEAISNSGLDFIVIDTEHGTYDLQDVSALIRAADTRGLSPIVRVSEPTHREIQHALDEGAEGIIIPYLRRVEDFRKAAELGKFPPIGNRGFAWGRGSCFGNEAWSAGTPEEYMAASNEKAMLIPQCETAEALEHIEEIAAIDGIDGIFVGPWDLSICMGIPAQFSDPRFKEALNRILKACRAAGKICIIFANDPEDARTKIAMGFDAVSNGLDAGIISGAFRDMVSAIEAGQPKEKSCGAVVFTRAADGTPLYVIVEQRSGAHCFPKGHVNLGETEQETALREILEETGLRPVILGGFRESETYEIRKKHGSFKDVIYFIAEYADQPICPLESDEIRSVSLVPYEEAMDLLETGSRKAILTKAHSFLTQEIA